METKNRQIFLGKSDLLGYSSWHALGLLWKGKGVWAGPNVFLSPLKHVGQLLSSTFRDSVEIVIYIRSVKHTSP